MRQKTKNHRNQGSIDKKNLIFFAVPASHIQMGSLCAKNVMEKFSRLGTFKKRPKIVTKLLLVLEIRSEHNFAKIVRKYRLDTKF
jgi:hypothetical protein